MTERRKIDKGVSAKRLFGGLDAKTILVMLGLSAGSGGGYFGITELLGNGNGAQSNIDKMKEAGMMETPAQKEFRIRTIIDREINPKLENITEQLKRIERDVREIRNK